MRRLKLVAILLFGALLFPFSCAAQKTATAQSAPAAEDWQKQFDDICAKTQDAMVYSIEDLKALIQKCDALQPQVEKLDETRKKVYSRRLVQCRGLFAYVLESKQTDKK